MRLTRHFFSWMVFALAVWAMGIADAGASVYRFRTTESLVREADAIVRARVGQQTVTVDQETGVFTTQVRLVVTDELKASTAGTVEISVPGGVIGDAFNIITGQPAFETGQDVVVFLDESHERLASGLLGKYTIRDGMIFEKGIEAEDYVESIRLLASGGDALTDLDDEFHPVTTYDAYLQSDERFQYSGMKWYQSSINVTINENDPDGSGEGTAVKTALQEWNNVPADFKFNYAGGNSRTDVTQNYNNEIFWSNDTEGNAIAYTAIWGAGDQVVECDLAFLNSYDWSHSGEPQGWQMDTQNIATHELGHFLVLADLYNASDAQKTMYGYAGPGETYKRSLHQDDKDGMIWIYGSGTADDDADDDTSDDDDDDDDDWHDDDDDDDDDDGGSGDDDDSDVGPAGDCDELISIMYGQCGFALIGEDGPIMSSEAGDLCESDQGPWDCLFTCAANDKVTGCNSYRMCLEDLCGLSLYSAGSSSGDDDDDDAGFCGG